MKAFGLIVLSIVLAMACFGGLTAWLGLLASIAGYS
jgi:hypothetical protein